MPPANEQHHILHYLILFIGLIVFSLLFFLFRYQTGTQIYIAFFGSVFYFAWGTVHHVVEGRLTKLIALEYFLISLLVFALVMVVLIL
jgi:hypothetical protein